MNTDRPATTPIVNMNGTGRQALLDERMEALGTVQQAIEALCAMTVHPRDWQTRPDGDREYRQARELHRIDIENLRSIEQRLIDEVIALQDDGR